MQEVAKQGNKTVKAHGSGCRSENYSLRGRNALDDLFICGSEWAKAIPHLRRQSLNSPHLSNPKGLNLASAP